MVFVAVLTPHMASLVGRYIHSGCWDQCALFFIAKSFFRALPMSLKVLVLPESNMTDISMACGCESWCACVRALICAPTFGVGVCVSVRARVYVCLCVCMFACADL